MSRPSCRSALLSVSFAPNLDAGGRSRVSAEQERLRSRRPQHFECGGLRANGISSEGSRPITASSCSSRSRSRRQRTSGPQHPNFSSPEPSSGECIQQAFDKPIPKPSYFWRFLCVCVNGPSCSFTDCEQLDFNSRTVLSIMWKGHYWTLKTSRVATVFHFYLLRELTRG